MLRKLGSNHGHGLGFPQVRDNESLTRSRTENFKHTADLLATRRESDGVRSGIVQTDERIEWKQW